MNEKFRDPTGFKSFFEGIKERGEELDKTAKKKAAARGREFFEKVFLGLEIPHEEKVEVDVENKLTERFMHMNKEQLFVQLESLREYKGAAGQEGKRLRRALLKVAASKGYLDDLMGMMHEKGMDLELIEDLPDETQTPEGEAPENEYLGEEFHSHEKLGYFLQTYLKGDKQAGRLLAEVQEIGKRMKHPEYAGFSKFDPDTKNWIVFDQKDPKQREESKKRALEEIQKLAGREMFQQSPHLFMNLRHAYEYEVNEDGDIVLATDEEGKPKLALRAGEMGDFETEAYQAAFAAQPAGRISEHPQPRTSKWAMSGEKPVIDKEGFLIGDKIDFERIKKMWNMSKEGIVAFWRRIGGAKSEGGDVKFRCFHVDNKGRVVKGVEEKYVFILDPEKSIFKDKEEVTQEGIYQINPDQSLTRLTH